MKIMHYVFSLIMLVAMGTIYPLAQEKPRSYASSKLPERTLSKVTAKLVKSASGDNMGDALLVAAQAQKILAQIPVRHRDMEEAFSSAQSSRAESLTDEQQQAHTVDAADDDNLFSKMPGTWAMPLADGLPSKLIYTEIDDTPDVKKRENYMKELKRDIKKLEPTLTAYFSTLPENKKQLAENLTVVHLLNLLRVKYGNIPTLMQDIRSIRQSRSACCIIQ